MVVHRRRSFQSVFQVRVSPSASASGGRTRVTISTESLFFFLPQEGKGRGGERESNGRRP